MSATEVDSSREACAVCSTALPPAEVHVTTDRATEQQRRQQDRERRRIARQHESDTRRSHDRPRDLLISEIGLWKDACTQESPCARYSLTKHIFPYRVCS